MGGTGADPVAARRADDMRALLEPGSIRAVFQPIVRLTDLAPIGYEGLARFPTPPGLIALPPDVTLAAAGRAGLRQELEVACWAAIAEAGAPPEGRLLFVNIGPDYLGHPGLLELAERLPARLVIELTEQDAVQDCARLVERLRPWLARGAMVAVDDAGAGFTSLEYVAEIRPDFLKLARGMVTGVDQDPRRQAVLRATIAFAHEVGAQIVAEGVEREEELALLREAGADLGQGWLFGRPGAPWPEAERLDAPTTAPGGGKGALRRSRLQRELGEAPNAREAADVVLDHLARLGLMPSVFVEQGGRLRCLGARGYWQIYDGMPLSAGVVGTTFRTGRTAVVEDVAEATGYLHTAPAVVAEVAVPLRVDGRVVGVLNADSSTRLDDRIVVELECCAKALGDRLGALEPLDAASPAQVLARTAVRLAALEDSEGIVRETIAAARELSGFESAMLARPDGDGGWYVHHAEGPFSIAFAGLLGEDLRSIASWIETGTSSYTLGDSSGKGFAGHEPLRHAGARALMVLPLWAAGERVGMMVLADRTNLVLPTEQVELLELLAMHSAAGLRMAAAVMALRERASRDPLTGLGHHGTFLAAIPAARGFTARRVALLMVDVDHFKTINDTRGHAAGDDVLRALSGVLQSAAPAGGRAFRVGGDEFALVCEVDDAASAERIGWDLQTRARTRLGTTLSIGVALAEPGEPDDALIARADAALYAVKRNGRDGVELAAPAQRVSD
jgi:diguanylate cyclase (GGDEF)-like protein